MPRLAQKSSRRQQILEALARMLEESPGERITTAGLASAVGVSEAALYRHFPSKAKMFEGLIDYVEEVILTRINAIMGEELNAQAKLERICALLLGFAEKNPGISRILNGDALAGETERVRGRVVQFYDRVDLQLKQVLRDAELYESLRCSIPAASASNMLMAVIEGKICQYVRSKFKRLPTQYWPEQWEQLINGFFREVAQPQHSISRQQSPIMAKAQ